MQRIVAILVLLASLSACGPAPFIITPPHPTAAEIAALATLAETITRVMPAPFNLRVYPSFAYEGSAVWVTCFVPDTYGAGRIRYGIDGIRASDDPLTGRQYRLLVEHLPCGVWTAYCAVRTATREETRQTTLIVHGSCDG